MPELVLGPLLRHVSETTATVWVETDAPCAVSVLGHASHTFQVAGHHYALVTVDGLEPDSTRPYRVSLDGVACWPEAESRYPPSLLRTLGRRPLALVFGSCRVAAPHEPPYTDSHGVDALWALAEQMRNASPESWPDVLLMLGDQVYADELSPKTREFIHQRRTVLEPPFQEVADYEEYSRLYWESWGDPPLRWLLANLPSAMIFDDHDVHDDWNTSAAWRADIAQQPWWQERITSGFMSYWVYQHLGNLAPDALAHDPLYQRLRTAEDATDMLREFAASADASCANARWSFSWELGSSRLVVVDSRAGRVLTGGRREMIDEDEWRFVEQEMHAPAEQLLLATSLPFLLPRALHELEAWNEAVCAGAWGRLAARAGEQIRRRLDLEHWAAFQSSFKRLSELVKSVATGARGQAPASVVVLSGDVHYAYLAKARFGDSEHAPVYQAVCSPLRNVLPSPVKRAMRAALSDRAFAFAARLARWAGVPAAPLEWQLDGAPFFDNQLAVLLLDGREATVRLERATLSDGEPRLEAIRHWRLTPEQP